MKKSSSLLAYGMFLVGVCSSCSNFHHGGDIKISISDSKNSYKMTAYFNDDKTAKVHEYMNEHLGDQNNFSFANTQMDATLTLDDRTTFYIRSSPGDIEINLDKEKNSYDSYMQVKEMCEGIKTVLAQD